MKNIIIREYLESLTESEELDYIFPILLEVMGFKILSTPRLTKGLAQYGKDIVATGTDKDGVQKRFYFEIKGGADKDVTTTTFTKTDGIRESIIEAKDRKFNDSSNPGFDKLPVKIVLVHNGVLRANVKETFDGFIEREFPRLKKSKRKWWQSTAETIDCFEFERWDIYELTELFTQHLFNEYLLTDAEATNRFKKVLVLINTPRNNYADYLQLIDHIFEKAGALKSMGERKRLLFFETLRMVTFIVYHYSKDAHNLNAALKCVPYTVLNLWSWVLEHQLENDQKVIVHFDKCAAILYQVFTEFSNKTLTVAKRKNGLWAPNGGRYEQIGYPLRAMDYLSHLLLYFQFQRSREVSTNAKLEQQVADLVEVLNNNDGTTRPLLDNHSIPICLTLNFLIENGMEDEAKTYLQNIQHSVQIAHYTYQRIPDGRNRIESVIRFVVRKQKSVYYEDSTSHLFGMMLEYMALLGMEEAYYSFKKFLIDLNIHLGVFVPYDDQQLKDYRPENNLSHEANLLSRMLHSEGYQSEVCLDDSFADFQTKVFSKPVFTYIYRTQTAGYGYLLVLAHVYLKTPLFPSAWRRIKIST